jgi:signal transduction histidine kinase
MRSTSLRWRLVLLAAVSIFASLTVAGLSLAWIFERHIEVRVTRELDIRLKELLAGFTLEDGQPAMSAVLSDPRYSQPYSGVYWQIADASGPLIRSRSLWDQSLPARKPSPDDAGAFELAWTNDTMLYALDQKVVFHNDGKPRDFSVTVAIDHSEIDIANRAFVVDVVEAMAAIGFALLAGAWLQINLGLRPLRHLRRSLAAIRDGRAAQLEGDLPLEVAPLAEEFNSLLTKHSESLHKARERAGSLAHGLKTPMTILAGEARRLDDQGLFDMARTLRDQLDTMRRHVDRELARARSHGSAAKGGLHTEAAKSIARLIDLVQRMPRGRDIEFHNLVPPGLILQIDPDDFGEIVGNLLDNARKYARTNITLSASWAGNGRFAVQVDDDGPGIPEAMRERLRERGERADDQPDGSGLGLTIVLDILSDYEASLEIMASPSGGCRMSFMLAGTDASQPQAA